MGSDNGKGKYVISLLWFVILIGAVAVTFKLSEDSQMRQGVSSLILIGGLFMFVALFKYKEEDGGKKSYAGRAIWRSILMVALSVLIFFIIYPPTGVGYTLDNCDTAVECHIKDGAFVSKEDPSKACYSTSQECKSPGDTTQMYLLPKTSYIHGYVWPDCNVQQYCHSLTPSCVATAEECDALAYTDNTPP